MKAADVIANLKALNETARPKNPAEPKAGSRVSYLITFDYGVRDTDGMLDALRKNGHHAITKSQ